MLSIFFEVEKGGEGGTYFVAAMVGGQRRVYTRGGKDKVWYLLQTGVLCNKARDYLYLMALGCITQHDRLQEIPKWRLTGLGTSSAIHGGNTARYCTIILARINLQGSRRRTAVARNVNAHCSLLIAHCCIACTMSRKVA